MPKKKPQNWKKKTRQQLKASSTIKQGEVLDSKNDQQTNGDSHTHPHAVVAKFERFSGPFPPPEMLAEYDRVFPGSAERIFNLTETQSKHRQKMEQWVIISGVIDSKIGMLFGLIVTSAVLYISFRLIMSGHGITGFSFVITNIAALVYAFRYANDKGKQELENKKALVNTQFQEDSKYNNNE